MTAKINETNTKVIKNKHKHNPSAVIVNKPMWFY